MFLLHLTVIKRPPLPTVDDDDDESMETLDLDRAVMLGVSAVRKRLQRKIRL